MIFETIHISGVNFETIPVSGVNFTVHAARLQFSFMAARLHLLLWAARLHFASRRHASILHQGGTPAFSHDGGTPHPQWRLVETLIAVHLILEFAGWQVSAVLFRWHACNLSFVAARLHLLLGAARLHFYIKAAHLQFPIMAAPIILTENWLKL